jgi:hypothetical protein
MNHSDEYLKMTETERETLYNSFLKEPDAFYEKAENDLLKKSLKMTYKERFLTMTRLMKTGLMLKKAKIINPHSNAGK